MRWIRNSYWFWMASSFFDTANISRNHSSSSSYTLPDRGGEHAATKHHQKISVGKSDEKNPRLDWTRAEGGGRQRDRGRTWCRNWWRGRRRAAGCRRGPRRCCRRRWRRRRRPPRRSTPTPCPAATASRPVRSGRGPETTGKSAAAALALSELTCRRNAEAACGSRDALGAPPALYRPRRSAAGQSGGEHARSLDSAGPRCR